MFEKIYIIRITFNNVNMLDAKIIDVQGFASIEGCDIAQYFRDLEPSHERIYIYRKLRTYEHFMDVFKSKLNKDQK